jgi:hypothetical protein
MDEGTYVERVTRVAHMMDVRTAFASNAQVQEALQVREEVPRLWLSARKTGGGPPAAL